jgi:hypothetical protein
MTARWRIGFGGSGTKEAHWMAPPQRRKPGGGERWWWHGGVVEGTSEMVVEHYKVKVEVTTVAVAPGNSRRLLHR